MNILSQNKLLALSSMAIALSLLSLLLFRGTMSLLSAITIPVFLSLFLYRHTLRAFIITAMALLAASVFFFTTQFIFVLGYVLLACLLRRYLSHFLAGTLSKVEFALYMLAVAIVIYLGIRMTEWIFLIPLHQMMLNVSKGYWQIYGSVLIAETFVVAFFHRTLLRTIALRVLMK